MNVAQLKNNDETAQYIYPLAIAVVTTTFLFYIDEGNYNFGWTRNIGNWLVFLVYVGVIYGVQLLFALPLFRFVPRFILNSGKIILMILVVMFLALMVVK